jgi:hypothetical protein
MTARSLFLAMLAIAAALALLGLAAPRLQATLVYLPVDTALDRYFRENVIPGAQLAALRARAEAAIAHHPHYRYFDGLSQLNYLEALHAADKPWLRRPALNRSLDAGLEAVARAPAKPRTWLRIARIRAALGSSPAAVVDALTLSILTGRFEPTLLLPRLELGLLYAGVLDEESRALLSDQALLAWRTQERAFRRALDEGRLDLSRLESVLGNRSDTIVRALENPG